MSRREGEGSWALLAVEGGGGGSGTVWLESFIDGPLQAVLLACGM